MSLLFTVSNFIHESTENYNNKKINQKTEIILKQFEKFIIVFFGSTVKTYKILVK